MLLIQWQELITDNLIIERFYLENALMKTLKMIKKLDSNESKFNGALKS